MDTQVTEPPLNVTQENAFALSRAALLLDEARRHRGANGAAGTAPAPDMSDALRHNVEIWIAIRTLVKRANGALPEEIKANLLKLGDFVVGTTLRDGEAIADHTLETLININLQISEGLLEAATP